MGIRLYKLLIATATCTVASVFAVSAATNTEESYAPVLAPGQFAGEASMGYAAASAVPQICAKLFCYCGCDSTDNHFCLLDCFTSMHGSDCHICQEEALMALRMHKEGKSLKEIQKSVDDTYSHMYPFKNPTQTLKNYRAHKLYAGNPAVSSQEKITLEQPAASCCSARNN
jgi:hypothetical protein